MTTAIGFQTINPCPVAPVMLTGWTPRNLACDRSDGRAVVIEIAIAQGPGLYSYDGPWGHDTTTGAGVTMGRYFAAQGLDIGGFVSPTDRIAANPINRTDPTGLMGGGPGNGHNIDYPYKELPGAKFHAVISANSGTYPGLGYVDAEIEFLVPESWRLAGNGGQCDEIKIIQVVVKEEYDYKYGYVSRWSDSWNIDKNPTTNTRTPFYGDGDTVGSSTGSTPWTSANRTSSGAKIQDGPGAKPLTVAHVLQTFRDYAIATKGKDKGVSYGYFEWGQEWFSTAPTSQKIWTTGHEVGRNGKFGDPLYLSSGFQIPKAGGVRDTGYKAIAI